MFIAWFVGRQSLFTSQEKDGCNVLMLVCISSGSRCISLLMPMPAPLQVTLMLMVLSDYLSRYPTRDCDFFFSFIGFIAMAVYVLLLVVCICWSSVFVSCIVLVISNLLGYTILISLINTYIMTEHILSPSYFLIEG